MTTVLYQYHGNRLYEEQSESLVGKCNGILEGFAGLLPHGGYVVKSGKGKEISGPPGSIFDDLSRIVDENAPNVYVGSQDFFAAGHYFFETGKGPSLQQLPPALDVLDKMMDVLHMHRIFLKPGYLD